MRGKGAFKRVRNTKLLILADKCTTLWNPVRTFSSGVGTQKIPHAAKDWLGTARLVAIEQWLQTENLTHNKKGLQSTSSATGQITFAKIVLYQFLEFTEDCYDVDMAKSGGIPHTKDVYNRIVSHDYPLLSGFYREFCRRLSAWRDPDVGEVATKILYYE